MFKAATAFTISKREQPVSTAIGMDKQMCYIHTMEYYSTIKDVVALSVSKRKNKMFIHCTTWMELYIK